MHGGGRGEEPAAYRRLRWPQAPLLPQLAGFGLQGGGGRRSARARQIAQQIGQVGCGRARGLGGLRRVGTLWVRIGLALGRLLLLIVRCGRLALRLAARL